MSQLRLHNSLSGTREVFEPLEAGRVRLYVCGVTVYDRIHLGHARMMVVFDVLAAHLRKLGYAVDSVRNITDVDDKIIARAKEAGEAPLALAERYALEMGQDLRHLGVATPSAEPRAGAHITDMLAMIATLVDRGHAYATNQ